MGERECGDGHEGGVGVSTAERAVEHAWRCPLEPAPSWGQASVEPANRNWDHRGGVDNKGVSPASGRRRKVRLGEEAS